MEEMRMTMKAMCHQENSAYGKRDFIPLIKELKKITPKSKHHAMIDLECRKLMVGWCNNLIDCCKMDRGTVEITMSLVDRFLFTEEGKNALMDRNVYQLVCMTLLYTAIKMNEEAAITPDLVASLSQGRYTKDHVEEMEFISLKALNFRVNPPTSFCFAYNLLDLTPNHILDTKTKKDLFERSKSQAELALVEQSLVSVKASKIAYCALVNALDMLYHIERAILQYLETQWAECLGLDIKDTSIEYIQTSLDYATFSRDKNILDAFSGRSTSRVNVRHSTKHDYEESPRSSVFIQEIVST